MLHISTIMLLFPHFLSYQNNLDIQYGILINFGHTSGKLEYVIWDKSKESKESTISAITQGISDLTKTTLVID